MFEWISQLFAPRGGGVPRRRVRHTILARYDAAQTTVENRRHWAAADNLSANAANSPEVRKILRARARYEVANNSFARGIVNTIANYTIGSGPQLQVRTDDNVVNDAIEDRFGEWADEVRLAEKLRVMRMACVQDGEAFAILKTNRRLESPVKLDLQLVEADQVTTPGLTLPRPGQVDGIIFDEFGNPQYYSILRHHPGDPSVGLALEADLIKAEFVIHYYHVERPGQCRGIPELTPALPLFAQLRRYTAAVLAAAETAADIAAVLQSDSPAYIPEDQAVTPFDVVELEPRMATVLPAGWKIGQIEAHHPSTTYSEFVRQILCEIARCVNMPLAVALGDASQHNYASGRLDYQNWYRALKVERSLIERVILTPILRTWLNEAILVSDFLPLRVRMVPFTQLRREWFWDGLEHVDPVKEATARKILLEANLTTLANECARDGKDWETVQKQRAKEIALQRELGLTVPETVPTTGNNTKDNDDDE